MSTIHLPDGGTAEIVDEEGITGYAEQVVTEVLAEVESDDNIHMGRVGAAFMRSRVELLPHVVTSWSYEPKVTLDAVMRLPRSVRAALVEQTKHLHQAITLSLQETQEPDPKSEPS